MNEGVGKNEAAKASDFNKEQQLSTSGSTDSI
jgi:hypothetical protein